MAKASEKNKNTLFLSIVIFGGFVVLILSHYGIGTVPPAAATVNVGAIPTSTQTISK